MQRRFFATGLGCALASAAGWSAAAAAQSPWSALETSVGGRLGVAVIDCGDGRVAGHRLDERFAMCSTFKWLVASLALQRADAGLDRLDRTIRYGANVLLPHSPVTEQHVGKDGGMTIGELCAAAVGVSDNAAANLLLAAFGGPAAVTAHARRLGDTVTRLDRTEPALNEARPGDPRDTTTPRAMGSALRVALLGDVLSPTSRSQLSAWLAASTTGGERLRAGLRADWRIGDKTGTGERGSTNDVAFCEPPGRAPIVVTAFLTETTAPPARRNAAIAEAARVAVAAIGA